MKKKMSSTFGLLVVLVATFVDNASAKGTGSGKKNEEILTFWKDQHITFEQCVTSKCAKLCENKSSIMIGENKDYKQEVLSVECTNCEVQCFVPPIGESKHLVENKAEDKGEKVANMRHRISGAKKRNEHRQAYKLGKSWRIKE